MTFESHSLGGLSVAATEERRIAVVKGAAKKAVATRVPRGRKAASGEME